MLVSRVPGAGAWPPGWRSYSPSMLFRWIPVPGTMTPEPEPVDAESDAALPSASTAEMCVVPPGDARSAGARSALRRRRSPGGERVLGEQAPSEPAAVELAREARSRARACSRITSTSARQLRRRARLARRRRAGRAARARSRSARRPTTAAGSTRTRGPGSAAVTGRRRITRYDVEVCGVIGAAVLLDVTGDRRRDVSAVERVRPVGRERLERVREVVGRRAGRLPRAASARRRRPCSRACGGGSSRAARAAAPAPSSARRPRARARSPARAARATAASRRRDGPRRAPPPCRARRRTRARSGSAASSRCRSRRRCRPPPSRPRAARSPQARGGDEEVEQPARAVARAVDEHEPARARAR